MINNIYKKMLFIILILICFSLNVCNNKDRNNDGSDSDKDLKIINLYHYWDDSFEPTIKSLESISDRFSLKHEGYRLIPTYINHEAFKVMIRNVDDNAPELFTYWAGMRTRELVQLDQIAPIDDLWQEYELDNIYPQSIINSASTYNGKKYLVPITLFIIPVIYNVKMFNRYNLEPPSDWADFLEVCGKLKEEGITPIALGAFEGWPAQYWFDYILLGTAGIEYRERLLSGDASYTDPEVIRVFSIWKELISAGYINNRPHTFGWEDTVDMFYNGKVAMTLMGQWFDKKIQELGWEGVKDYDYFRFPQIDNNMEDTLLVVFDGLILHTGSENKSGAKKVMGYLANKESQMLLSKATGGLSPNKTIDYNFYPEIKKKAIYMFDSSDNWTYAFDLESPTPVTDIVLRGLIEFMEFPKQFMVILQDIEKQTDKVFSMLDNDR